MRSTATVLLPISQGRSDELQLIANACLLTFTPSPVVPSVPLRLTAARGLGALPVNFQLTKHYQKLNFL